MSFDYNKVVQKVDAYLRRKRAGSRVWSLMLPERLFTPELWLWEPRSVARGAAWGTSWAIAPVPLQMVFTVLCSIWTRGNVPMSVLACCISFPGYQVFAWPLQWYVGAIVLSSIGLGSGIDMELIRSAAAAATQGWSAVMHVLQGVSLLMIGVELLLGCLVTCTLMGVCTYSLVMLLWRKK
ncbi:MAG: DUF2062 domain-containing protein [Akkermansia sp.]|nr:DUF2062 domain-containing protein [Akkermansia sp.]